MNIRDREWRRFRREVEINNRRTRVSGNSFLNEKPLRDGELSKSKGIPSFKFHETFKCNEKNWKMMYFRKDKLHRARKLGIEYPPRTLRQVLDDEAPTEFL